MKTEEYARWFRASTPYISAHRDRTFVIALNGEALMHGNLANIVHDLALLNVLGARLVVVHGARPQLDAALPGSAFHTHAGTTRRITDREAMGRVTGVCGQLRAELEALFSTGLPTSPLHNTEIQLIAGNFVIAKPIGVLGGVDHELTGQARRIRTNGIGRALDTGAIVLLSPIGYSPSGQAFNLAADELAERVAVALQADKLIAFDKLPYLQSADGKRLANLSPTQLQAALGLDASEDAPGSAPVDIRRQQDSPASSSREPEPPTIAPVGENTRRNLRALVGAVRGGVTSGQMVSYADDGALLAELFTAEGVGTQITEEDRRLVRRAEPRDVADIVELIRPLEESGMLVKRSRDRLEREIDQFFIAEIDGIVVGLLRAVSCRHGCGTCLRRRASRASRRRTQHRQEVAGDGRRRGAQPRLGSSVRPHHPSARLVHRERLPTGGERCPAGTESDALQRQAQRQGADQDA